MRSNIPYFIMMLVTIMIVIVCSVSLPWARAEQTLFPVTMVGESSSPVQTQSHGTRVYRPERKRPTDFMVCSGRQRDARLYGTGTLDIRDDYLVGVKVTFRFNKWGDIGRAIMGVFNNSARARTKELTRISVVLDGPDSQ